MFDEISASLTSDVIMTINIPFRKALTSEFRKLDFSTSA